LASFSQKSRPGIFKGSNRMRVQRQDAANVRDYDLYAFRKVDLARVAPQKMDAVRKTVDCSKVPAKVDDTIHVDRIDTSRASLAS
jgi:hypothetical protein